MKKPHNFLKNDSHMTHLPLTRQTKWTHLGRTFVVEKKGEEFWIGEVCLGWTRL